MGTIIKRKNPPPPNASTQRILGWTRGVEESGIGMSELELIDEGRSKEYIKGYFDAKEFRTNWDKINWDK